MDTPKCHTLHIYTVEYLKLQSSTYRCFSLYEFRDFVWYKYLDSIYLLSPHITYILIPPNQPGQVINAAVVGRNRLGPGRR